MTPRERLESDLRLLRSIEWVTDATLGFAFCPSCCGEQPAHKHGCKLQARIDEQVVDLARLGPVDGGCELDRLSAQVLSEIFSERIHQRDDNGYTADQDDGYVDGELARGGAAFLLAGSLDERGRAWLDPDAPATARSQYGWAMLAVLKQLWPATFVKQKFKGRRRDLIRGLAMGVAEVERLDRAARADSTRRD